MRVAFRRLATTQRPPPGLEVPIRLALIPPATFTAPTGRFQPLFHEALLYPVELAHADIQNRGDILTTGALPVPLPGVAI